MIFNNIRQGLKTFGGIIVKNSPSILTGFGCAGVFGTALLTGRATLKADELIKMEEEYLHDKLSTPEVIKLTWKCFIPPIAMGAVSISCIIGANSINSSRNAALAALYSLSETALHEYKEQVAQEIGRNKELRIRDNVAQNRVTNNPVGDRTVIITGNGNVLCYDVLCDRYFRSSQEKIRQKVLELNEDLRNEMWLDLNDFYYAIGLPYSKLGRKVGFDMNKGYIKVDFSATLTEEGEPCLSVDATVYPKDEDR